MGEVGLTGRQRIELDKAFYDRVRRAKQGYRLVGRHVIPPASGQGFRVPRGHTIRVIEIEGPQIADVAFWNLGNPAENFSALRTWEIEGWFVRIYTRLWSDVPWLRPLATCVDETLDSRRPKDEFHHHSVASQCSAEQVEMRTGRAGQNACRLNLLQAIEPYGLKEHHIFDNLDIFMKLRLDPVTGRYLGARTDATPGDHIEFYAEQDLLVGISVSPDGDNSTNSNAAHLRRPLGVEIHDTGIAPREFPSWSKRYGD